MQDYPEVLERLLDKIFVSPDNIESISLDEAIGRCLAEDYLAKFDSPIFSQSAMDGYAIAFDNELALCGKHFIQIERIAAGSHPALSLQKGECARIFTGAPIPAGTTAVVAQEDVKYLGDKEKIQLNIDVEKGCHIRYQGEEFSCETCLIEKGSVLQSIHLALLASQGYAKICVYKKPKIVIFSTGNELLELDQAWQANHIYDANRYQLKALSSFLPLDITDGGILPDDPQTIRQAFIKALELNPDFILTSGGASVGEEDHLKAVIQSLGHLDLWRLAIKPGKPFGFGQLQHSQILMLPGNTVASFVMKHLMVLPLLKKRAGHKLVKPVRLMAISNFSNKQAIKRREFLRIKLMPTDDGRYLANLLPHQGSAQLSSCTEADGLADIPAMSLVEKGDLISVVLMQMPH